MATAAIYLPFDEIPNSIYPQDAEGNGQCELLVAAGSVPLVVSGNALGHGRQFDDTNCFLMTDTDLTGYSREVTAAVVGSFDLASIGNGNSAYLLAHGELDGTFKLQWGLRLEVLDSASGLARMRAVWHDGAGTTLVSPDGMLVQIPAGDTLLGFTRFQDSDTIKVRYFVGDRFSDDIASPAASPFDIHEASVAANSKLYVGGINDGAGALQDGLHGILTNALIAGDEVAGEEVAIFWKSVSLAAESSRAMMAAYKPSNVYSSDPEVNVNKELRNEAGAYSFMKGTLDEVSVAGLADKAFGPWLERFEQLYRIEPQATDSIAERRARLLSHTQNVLAFNVPSIQLQLRELFGFATDSQVAILEQGNTKSEAWTSDQLENWLQIVGSATIAHNAGNGTLEIDRVGGGAAASRYRGIIDNAGGFGATMALYPVRGSADNMLRVKVDVTAYSRTGTEKSIAGIVIADRTLDEWFFFGFGELGTGTADETGYWRFTDGDEDGNAAVLGDPYSVPVELVVTYKDGLYSIAADDGVTSDSDSGLTGPLNPGWVGLVLIAPADQAGNDAMNAEFDDLEIIDANGTQRKNWYAYRDPALLATPYSLAKAQKLIDRIEPSDTRGRAIDTQAGLDVEGSTLTSRDFIGTV